MTAKTCMAGKARCIARPVATAATAPRTPTMATGSPPPRGGNSATRAQPRANHQREDGPRTWASSAVIAAPSRGAHRAAGARRRPAAAPVHPSWSGCPRSVPTRSGAASDATHRERDRHHRKGSGESHMHHAPSVRGRGRARSAVRAGVAASSAASSRPGPVSRYRCRGGRPAGTSLSQAVSSSPRSASRMRMGYMEPALRPICWHRS